MRKYLNKVEKKLGVKSKYKSDKELFKSLKAVPSLVKLIKMTTK